MAEKNPEILPNPLAGEVALIGPPPQRRAKSKLIVAIILAGIVIVASALWYTLGSSADSAAAGASPKSMLALVPLEGFIVNLNDGGENHYLRVTLNLGVEHVPEAKNKEKNNSGLPSVRIRDTIVSVLTDSKADVLLSHEGKLQLKKNLIDALNREVPELGVREVYFTEFLVQR